MSLELQFQSLVASFLYGLALGFGYGLFNRITFHVKWMPIRYGLEIINDCAWLFVFFFLIVSLNNGHFNLYLFLCLILGIAFYEWCFAAGYLFYLEYIMRFFRWFFCPIHFIFSKISGILKKMRKVIGRGKKTKNKIKSW